MKLIFATTNKHKIQSAESVLSKYGIEVEGVSLDIPEIQADESEEIIKDKVAKCFEKVGKPLIAMDSGLFIESLGGFPGPYTKYVLDKIGVDGILKLTKDLPSKKSYVQRMIGYTDGKETKIFASRGYGEIIQERRGEQGYNYDPIFYVPERNKTLAEMGLEERVEVWGDAWEQLGRFLTEKSL